MSHNVAYSVASTVKATNTPPIAMVSRWGSEYKDPGSKPVINLSSGVPGEQPHPLLIERLSKVVLGPTAQNGDTTITGGSDSAAYGSICGDVTMRKALIEEMKFVYGGKNRLHVDIQVEDMALTAGCNAAFMATVMAITERGDEVIVPMPWYFNNEMTLRILGIEPIALPVSIEAGFLPTVEHAERLITRRTKAIALVTPNNPSGVTYPASTIRGFADLAVKHKIALIIDETYRDFVISGPPHDLFTPKENWNWRSNIIHLFSFSKSYRVPGYRLGVLVADRNVIDEIEKILDCLQICPARPLQLALAPVLPSLRQDLAEQSAKFTKRHEIFRDAVRGSGWEVGASGGYFAMIKHPFKGVSGVEVCRRLALECGVVLLPLSSFVLEGDSAWDDWMRVSVANVGEQALREAATRIRESGKALGYE
ncbi:pyridoxal phosphate-dependent transferase [Rhizoctonia solani]|nr:pyridoxal phosphate-dependent transferase [Rhizoctonia solani]